MSQSAGFLKNMIVGVLLVAVGGAAGYRIAQRGGLQSIVSSSLSSSQTVRVLNTDSPSQFKDIDFQQFWQVWQTLQDTYFDPSKLQKDKMVYGAIRGMTAALGDPYTVFLEPTDQKRTSEDLSGAFYGVGIELGYIDNVLAVTAPVKDSPAFKAGVKPKDLILHVKDEKKGLDKDTSGWSLPEAVDKIRGDKGTSVILTLLRTSDAKPQPFKVTLERGEIIVPSAVSTYLDYNGKKIAHISLSRFGERTDAELNTIIGDIQKQSPKVDGIILDMRNNPGGFLDGAINVASEFMKSGVVVTQKGKTTSQDYLAKGNARLADYPLVIVVNGGSASAAEIVTGALRDQRGVELIGQKTFGKGTVQDAMQLPNGAGLHVTIAKWLLPKGDWIHEQGIPVTVEVKDDATATLDPVIEKAKQELFKTK